MCFKLAVVAELTHIFEIEAFEYQDAAVRNDLTVIRKPGFVVHGALPDFQRAATVYPGEKSCSQLEVFDELDLSISDLRLGLVHPKLALYLLQDTQLRVGGNIARTWGQGKNQQFL